MKEPSKVEVINDLDGNLMTFYRVLQDRQLSYELRRKLKFTPYARDAYKLARELLVTNRGEGLSLVDKAWCYFVLTRMSFSNCFNSAFSYAISYRVSSKADTFNFRIKDLYQAHTRIKHALIENDCALKVIKRYDSPDTFFYLDPPYFGSIQGYVHKIDQTFQDDLVALLKTIKGKFILSGYNDYGLSDICKVVTITSSSSAKNCKNCKDNTDRERLEHLVMNFDTDTN